MGGLGNHGRKINLYSRRAACTDLDIRMITVAILWKINLGGETGRRETSQEMIASVNGASSTGEEKAGLKYVLKEEQIGHGGGWEVRGEGKEENKDEPLTRATK